MNKKTILVTGSSGFIGMHLCNSLLKSSYQVLGLDNMNDYYNVSLKEDRLGHAYIFSGTRGIGKTTIARLFAKSLRCENRPEAINEFPKSFNHIASS